MAEVTVVYWRDIPAQVIVGKGRRGSKVQLPERFEQAIDRCAMKIGAKDADAYLALRQGRRQFVALQTPDGQLVYPQVPGIPEWYFSESAMTVRPTSEKTRSASASLVRRSR